VKEDMLEIPSKENDRESRRHKRVKVVKLRKERLKLVLTS
jgi:hypothetical protein